MEWINKGTVYTGINIDRVLDNYENSYYVADLCVRLPSGHWTEDPVSIFWVKKPSKPEFSNYFGFFVREGRPVITDGLSSVDGVIFRGTKGKNGEIIFSRWRHDYRSTEDDTATADGGRDYFRGNGIPVFLKVVGPEFVIVGEDELSLVDPT